MVTLHRYYFFLSFYVLIGYLYFTFHYNTGVASAKSVEVIPGLLNRVKRGLSELFSKIQFYFKKYGYMFLFVSLFVSLVRENYFLTVYLVILLGSSYSKKFNLPKYFSDKLETFKSDSVIIREHRNADFKLIVAWLHISWITLFSTFLLSPILQSPGVLEPIFFINGSLWFLCFEATILINLTLDAYIILFANSTVVGKTSQLCGKCAGAGCAIAVGYQSATAQGYAEPSELSNRVRTFVMEKPAISNSSDNVIHTTFQGLNIHTDEYTSYREHSQTRMGPPMRFIDYEKVAKVLELKNNKKILLQLGAEKSKIALGLIKPPANSLWAGWWTER